MSTAEGLADESASDVILKTLLTGLRKVLQVRRIGFALVLSLSASTSFAQHPETAESLFREAREDMKRGEPQQACPKFEQSYRLAPAIGTLLNLALCEEQLGRIATAWKKLHEFVAMVPEGDARLPFAKQKISELAPQLPKISIHLGGDGEGTIQLDGIELGGGREMIVPVDPGEHTLVVTTRTGEREETRITLARSEQRDVLLVFPQPPPEPASSRTSEPSLLVEPAAHPGGTQVGSAGAGRRANTERTLGYVVGALGIAGVLTSGGFGLAAIHEQGIVHRHCTDYRCADQEGADAARAGARYQTAADVAFLSGVLALGVGVGLVLHSGRTGVAVAGAPSSASVSVVGILP